MIIKGNTLDEESPVLVVRWTLEGIYGQKEDLTGEGVEVPDGATITDINFYGNGAMTQQVVFLPAWPDALEAPRAA